MSKVNIDVLKPWITKKVNTILGMEDDVIINYVFNSFDEANFNPKRLQINLAGFLNARHAREFMGELWQMMLEAQASEDGIPASLIDKKMQELKASESAAGDVPMMHATENDWKHRYKSLTGGRYGHEPNYKSEPKDADDSDEDRRRRYSPRRRSPEERRRRRSTDERDRKERRESPDDRERRRRRERSPEERKKRDDSYERRKERRERRNRSPEERKERNRSLEERTERKRSLEEKRERRVRSPEERERRRRRSRSPSDRRKESPETEKPRKRSPRRFTEEKPKKVRR